MRIRIDNSIKVVLKFLFVLVNCHFFLSLTVLLDELKIVEVMVMDTIALQEFFFRIFTFILNL